jgi:hypothetical protein
MSEAGSEIPAIDAREFLKTPLNGPEVKMLISPPDISLLRTLPTLEIEVGLALNTLGWYMMRGDATTIPLHWISPGAQVLLHSHTMIENTGAEEDAIPSLRDYLNCLPDARNLIVSSLGITEYSGPEDYTEQRSLRAAVDAFMPMFTRKEEKPEYLKFLDEIGAKYTVYLWEEITPEKLAELLVPVS